VELSGYVGIPFYNHTNLKLVELKKPKGQLVAGLSRFLGGDLQPPTVTVLTPATIPDYAAFYPSF
jgi:hypothetical protein